MKKLIFLLLSLILINGCIEISLTPKENQEISINNNTDLSGYSSTTTIKDAYNSEEPFKCTFIDTINMGETTLWINKKDFKQEFKGEKILDYFILSDGIYLYTWTANAKLGLKYSIEEVNTDEGMFAYTDFNSIDLLTRNVKCEKVNFAPISLPGIKFVTLKEMFELGKKDNCVLCDMIFEKDSYEECQKGCSL